MTCASDGGDQGSPDAVNGLCQAGSLVVESRWWRRLEANYARSVRSTYVHLPRSRRLHASVAVNSKTLAI